MKLGGLGIVGHTHANEAPLTTVEEILDRLSDIRVAGGTESDTRFKVIDDVLTAVLGWDKTDFTTEERVSEDGQDYFLDYLISTAQTSLLIEAKRAQIDFSKVPQSRRAALKGSWLKGDLRKAVVQARDYGRKKGVGFCVVTNGDTWIVFPVNRRDLVSFEDTYAIIFGNAAQALSTDYDDFHGLLSRTAVIDGSLEQGLLGGDSNQTDIRRLNRIYDHSFSKIARTTMFASIEDEIVTAFSEELVAVNSDLLEKAYVETSDRIKFDDRVKMAVRRREQVVNTRPMRVGRHGVRAAAEKVLTTRIRPQPVALLTLGLVGAGKTTFLNYVERVSGKTFFDQSGPKPRAHWLYIDFRSFSRSTSPRDFIYGQLFRYIGDNSTLGDFERTIKHAYAGEISNLTRGPLAAMKGNQAAIDAKISEVVMKEYEDKIPYCQRILSHAGKNTPLFLVIDNVDQIEDSAVQEQIFLEAVAIARDSNVNLVLAMRDATYVKSKTSAVFDAFTFDAIYIDAPYIQSVLSKRFSIAEQLLRGKRFELTTEGGATVTVSDAAQVVEMLSASVLGTEVGQLIEVAATGDVRLALQMTKQFLQFGYSTSYKSYLVFRRRGRYTFPVHEAIRAVMFGNQSIYRDEFSPILNPFDAKTGRSESQFLRLYIMNALVSAASTKTFQGIEAGEIIDSLEKLGFSKRTTDKVIHDLINSRVCFSKSHQDYTTESVLVPTRLCGYLVRDLVARMVFLETVIFDTFIFDDGTWNAIKTRMKSVYTESRPVAKFRIRKEIAKQFFDWCDQEVQKLCNEAAKRNLGPFWTTNPLARIRVDFEAELDRAFRSAVRNYGSEKERELLGLPLFQPKTGEGVTSAGS